MGGNKGRMGGPRNHELARARNNYYRLTAKDDDEDDANPVAAETITQPEPRMKFWPLSKQTPRAPRAHVAEPVMNLTETAEAWRRGKSTIRRWESSGVLPQLPRLHTGGRKREYPERYVKAVSGILARLGVLRDGARLDATALLVLKREVWLAARTMGLIADETAS